jgi:hypothetical protein
VNQRLEGWYTDPFGRHQARWMSDGVPTVLVRDSGVESHDDPSDEPWSQEPEVIAPPGGPDSMHRADEAQDEYFDPQRARDAAETVASTGISSFRHVPEPARRTRDDDRTT